MIASRYPDLDLVIAGEEDIFMARHIADAKKLGLDRLHFTGRITDAELAGFYANARAFVFPSSYEGFGLPPIEALSYGCPVISSNATCLPEVLANEEVIFFRSGDVDDMIRAIDSVLASPFLDRERRKQKGETIHERYSWKDVAQKTLDAYHRIGRT